MRKFRARILSCASLVLFVFLFVGCGSDSDSGSSFVATGSAETPASELSGDEATLTLESTLELERSITKSVTSLTFTSLSSTGTVLKVSEPVAKAPTISTKIPVETNHILIDYLDESGLVQEIWGSPIPPLKLNDSFVVREPNPDPITNVSRVEVTGPTTQAKNFPTQFRARATYIGGATRDVTNSATWSIDSSGSSAIVSPGGLALSLSSPGATLAVKATFGGRSGVGRATVVDVSPVGAPFFARDTSDTPLTALTLPGFGATAVVRVLSDFSDGVKREVTSLSELSTASPNIVGINALGLVRAQDAGQATVTAEFPKRTGQDLFPDIDSKLAALNVRVDRNFFTTIFEQFRDDATNVTGLSSAFVLADLNQDGRVDVVGLPASGSGTDYTRVQYFRGKGDGTFEVPVTTNLPLSAAPSAVPVMLVGSFRNSNDTVLIGNTREAGFTQVNDTGNGRLAASRRSLPEPPREFFEGRLRNLGTVDILVRTTANKLAMFNNASRIGDLAPAFPSAPSTIVGSSTLDADEFMTTAVLSGRGVVVQFQRRRNANDPLPRIELFILNAQRNALELSTFVNESSPPIFGLSDPSASRLELLLQGGFYLDLAPSSSPRQRLQAANTTRLSRFEFGIGTRKVETIASGGSVPELVSLGRSLSALPAVALSSDFSTGDVNEDGIDDIVYRTGDGNIRVILCGVAP